MSLFHNLNVSVRPSFSPCPILSVWLEISMCGRFAQAQTREEYLAYLADEADRDIAYDPEPIGR